MLEDSQKKSSLIALFAVLALVLVDQYTKWLAVSYLKGRASIELITNGLELSYLENSGAAFGMLQNQRAFFLILTGILTVGIASLFLRTPKTRRYLPLRVCMVVLTAGAIGNFIDRLLYGYVVDFIYISLIDFPVFNVADIYVTLTFFVLFFLLLFYYKEEELTVFTRKSGSQSNKGIHGKNR